MDFRREELLYLARIAEQGERYDDMILFLKELLSNQAEITSQERSLLSIAYKNAVGKKRGSLRILDNYHVHEENKYKSPKKALINKYRAQVENELKVICSDAIQTVTSLLELDQNWENKVFLYKMKADYYRYMSEYDKTDTKAASVAKAEEYYKDALGFSYNIPPADPLKLGLILNFSVFHYEIKNEKEIACAMAQKAFREGIADIQNLSEEDYKESAMILQLFRDNISLWS
jgi:14-3-3 protein epsilon